MEDKREPPLVITGDEPLPRQPLDEDDDSEIFFFGDVVRNFIVVNGLVMLGAALLPVYRPTMGATASARLDPATGKPVLLEARGCTVTHTAQAPERPAPLPEPGSGTKGS